MQLERTLAGVEDPPEVMAYRARDLFDADFGHQVQVDLGTDLGQVAVPGSALAHRGSDPRDHPTAVASAKLASLVRSRTRGMGEASPDHARLDVRVEPHRHGCLDAAAHDDEVVSERVSRPAPAVHLLAESLLLCRRHGLNNEDLEIWPAERIVLRGAEDHVVAVVSMLAPGRCRQANPSGRTRVTSARLIRATSRPSRSQLPAAASSWTTAKAAWPGNAQNCSSGANAAHASCTALRSCCWSIGLPRRSE